VKFGELVDYEAEKSWLDLEVIQNIFCISRLLQTSDYK